MIRQSARPKTSTPTPHLIHDDTQHATARLRQLLCSNLEQQLTRSQVTTGENSLHPSYSNLQRKTPNTSNNSSQRPLNTIDEPPVTCHDDDPTYVPTFHFITQRDFLLSVNSSICCLEQERATFSLSSGSSPRARSFRVSCSLVIGRSFPLAYHWPSLMTRL